MADTLSDSTEPSSADDYGNEPKVLTKVCNRCEKELPHSDYYNNGYKGGPGPYCKPCHLELGRIRHHSDKEKQYLRGKKWRDANKEKRRREWQKPSVRKKRTADKRRLIHQKIASGIPRSQVYNYEANRRYLRKRRLNPTNRLIDNYRTAVCMAITHRKKKKTEHILGCNREQFRGYLESKWKEGMSWNNYGSYMLGGPMTWHIDHIMPVSSFNFDNPEEITKCFHYTNCQPLWAIENLKKSDKIPA